MLANCAYDRPIIMTMPSRDETKAWVRAVLAHVRMKPTELARRIDRVPSTLNRFLNDPGADHNLSDDTISRIAEVAGVLPYEYPGTQKRVAGLGTLEAERFDVGTGMGDALVDSAVRNAAQARNAIEPWVLRSRALELAGYLPGDIVIVDLNEKARPHDVVCAEVFDWRTMRTMTVFRIYEAPFLIAASGDAELLKPFVVDDDAVAIRGVVAGSVRPRRGHALAA